MIKTRDYKEVINYHYGQQDPSGPRFAAYRLFYPSVTIETSLEYNGAKRLTIPTRIDALFEQGWEKHPVVLQVEQGQRAIIFLLSGGIYTTTTEDPLLMQYARQHGLLEGRVQGIKKFNA